ncbi:hypothetical protein [Coralloluteibacterium thermophilus]|uniref:Uncharacterized protein n=1 Tax=Coralloluteibacterium thermophilum TaxID=2707049 RepID=A0ABV9NFJ3_9GAMM
MTKGIDSPPRKATLITAAKRVRDHGPRRQMRTPQVYRSLDQSLDEPLGMRLLAGALVKRIRCGGGVSAVFMDGEGRCWCVHDSQSGYRQFLEDRRDILVGVYRSVRQDDLAADLAEHWSDVNRAQAPGPGED